MNRDGISGGLISLNSFLVMDEEQVGRRLASSSLREAALKEGVQSLYANPNDAIEKYKDFDIAKEMQDQKGKFLWVRARAIDADTVNANGDFFSKKELLKEVDCKGSKIPAYKTFEGVPIYTNHKNDDIAQAKGKVKYAEWDEKENCVWVVFFVDEEAYPNIARGIRQGYMTDVSMGCQVESGSCSICKNKATTEKEYCEHMEKFKGKPYPNPGDPKAYEINYGLKFIELSVVGDGAFETCEIAEIYDVDEIIDTALDIKKKVANIHNDLLIAGASLPQDHSQRQAYEECLRQVASTSKTIVKIAQTAGTLVGGQVLATDGSGSNTTVGSILSFLGIDPGSDLNILDMLNLALNFLEVTVMNLFARKDNIDLGHVAKITKSMGDLQSTMQDMIDDGVGAGGGNGAPMNQGALQQPQQQQQPAAPNGQTPDYNQAGNVGRAIGPMQTQNQAFQVSGPPIGGGVLASNNYDNLILWDSPNKKKRKTFASSNNATVRSGNKENSHAKLAGNLNAFAEALGMPLLKEKVNNSIKTETVSKKQISGGENNMDKIFAQFAENLREKDAGLVSIDFHMEDSEKENRITLCSNGDVRAYHKGVRVASDLVPELKSEHIEKFARNEGELVAADLLKQFKKTIASAKSLDKTITAWKEPAGTYDVVMEDQIKPERKGTDDDVKENLLDGKADEYGRKGEDNRTREETLEKSRTGTPELGKVREQTIEEDAGLYGWAFTNEDIDVREALIADARKGTPEDVIEIRLKEVRGTEDKSANMKEVVNASVNAFAEATVAARVLPSEIIAYAQKLSERTDLDELVAYAALGKAHREVLASRAAFYDVKKPINISAAIFDAFGKRVAENISATELADCIKTITKEAHLEDAVSRLASSKKDNLTAAKSEIKKASKEDQMRAALAASLDNSESFDRVHIKAALFAMADSALDAKAHPKEVVASINEMDENSLLMEVGLARLASATESRIIERERKQFYGNQRIASKSDVSNNTIGWLADYAEAFKIKDTAGLVKAAKKLAASSRTAIDLTTKVINNKTASVEVTDEKVTTKRIQCRIEDLDGIDVKSEDFEQQFREKAIQILSESGYTVDPATFSMSDVTVSASGDVNATISSRMSKTFKADGISAPIAAPIEAPVEDGSGAPEMTATLEASPVEGEVAPEGGEPDGITPQPYENEDVIMTAAAKESRKNRREAIIKMAQMGGMGTMPMGGGGAGAPGGGGMGTTPSPLDGALGDGADQGVSALTGGGPEPEMGAEDDLGASDGGKQPWGTICPQCGSKNVDVANGEGNCQDCGAQMEYQFSVSVKPGNDKDKGDGAEAPAPAAPEAPLGDDMGLGAATAPAPAPGGPAGAPPMGGGVMAQMSWMQDSDIFVRFARSNGDVKAEKLLPVGFICPSCGNRDTIKKASTTYCTACGTIARTKIAASTDDPTKLRVSIKWVD